MKLLELSRDQSSDLFLFTFALNPNFHSTQN